MADNVTVGSYTYSTDDVAGVHLQRCKIVTGADGVNGGDISPTNPLPATAQLSTSALMNGATAVTPAYASVDTATSGDNTIVDPGAGKKVRVLAFNLIAVAAAVNIYFKTGSTAKFASSSRPLVLDKTGATGPAGFNSGFNPLGWFEGAADENLVLNLSAAQGVIGNVVYVEL